MKRLVVGWAESTGLAKAIARKKGWKFSILDAGRFPDGEINLRFTCDVKGGEVYLVQTLHNPDERLMEVFFAAHTARELGAKKIVLIAPYLCYMRQDKRFRPYEAVSSRIMAKMMNSCLDGIMTIDPHLHRYKSLREIFTIESKTLTADGALADFIRKKLKNPLIIGPDAESYQWAKDVARMVGCEAIVLKKKRYTAKHVAIRMDKKLSFGGKSIAVIDDMISTGHTMAEVVKDVKSLGGRKIYCICIHPVFVNEAYGMLSRLGAKVISSNTIPHKTNRIDISDIIVKAL